MDNLQGSQLVTATRGEAAARVIPAHRHAGYVIGVATAGLHKVRCGGDSFMVGPGQLVAFNPYESHSATPACGAGWAYQMIHLDDDVFSVAAGESATRSSGSLAFRQPSFFDPLIRRHLLAIADVLARNDTLLAVEVTVQRAVACIIQRHMFGSTRAITGREHAAVRRVQEYLRANLTENDGLTALARMVNLNPNYLATVFTQTVGVPPHQFLDQLRIARAQEMISAGSPFSEVAAAVGYCDQSHMTRNFRRLVGMTPGVFRVVASPSFTRARPLIPLS